MKNSPGKSLVLAGKALLQALGELVPAGSKAEKRRRAAATFASMVGALVLARALDDEALSREILRAVRTAVVDQDP